MIYMTGDVTVIVLESANLDELRKGRPAKTPDGKILIAWTPDPAWLADRVLESDGDGATIGILIDEALKRPENPSPRSEPEEKSIPGAQALSKTGRMHFCHWPGCTVEVPPRMWGCPAHWFKLPKRIQNDIYAAYRPGQEIDKKPSPQYLRVAREAQEWIKEHYPETI